MLHLPAMYGLAVLTGVSVWVCAAGAGCCGVRGQQAAPSQEGARLAHPLCCLFAWQHLLRELVRPAGRPL